MSIQYISYHLFEDFNIYTKSTINLRQLNLVRLSMLFVLGFVILRVVVRAFDHSNGCNLHESQHQRLLFINVGLPNQVSWIFDIG